MRRSLPALLACLPLLAAEPPRAPRWIKLLGMTGVDQFELPGSNLVALGPEGVSALAAAAELKTAGRPKQAWTRAYMSRAEALLALQAAGKAAPVDVLSRIALDAGEHPAFRSTAALALGSAGGKEAAGALRKLLEDPALKSGNPRGEVLRLQQTPTISPAGTRDYPRRAAALAMGRLSRPDREGLPSLLWETLASEQETPHVRLASALALAEMGEGGFGGRLLALAGTLHGACGKAEREADRRDLQDLLIGVSLAAGTCARGEKDLGVLARVLADPAQPAFLRNAAAVGVGMAGRPDAAAALRPCLRDEDPEVRVGTAVAIGGLTLGRDAEARTVLFEVLANPDAALARAYAAISLGAFHSAETLEALERWGEDEDGGVRINCANAAGHLKGLDPRPFLESRLAQEPDSIIRWVLVGMLLDREPSAEARARILRMAREEGDAVLREKAVIKIQDLTGEDAGKAVRLAFKDAAPRVRRAAALTAGASGLSALSGDLKALLDDPFDTVRQAASESLSCLASGGPSEWMAKAVKDRRVHIDGSAGGEWARMRQRMTLEVLQIGPQDLEQLERYRRDLAGALDLAKIKLAEGALSGGAEMKAMTEEEIATARSDGRLVDYYT